jgi:hypothetical protein
MSGTAFKATTDLLKVDDSLGVVFGYAIVCREKDADGNWVDHYDTQGHHIPEDEMLKASVDFAQQASEDRAEFIAKALFDGMTAAQHAGEEEVDLVELVKAASKDMHEGEDIQQVVQMLPVTEELASALDWDIKKTGLVIALKPTADVLQLYKKGDRTGFSIGGNGNLTEVKEAA